MKPVPLLASSAGEGIGLVRLSPALVVRDAMGVVHGPGEPEVSGGMRR